MDIITKENAQELASKALKVDQSELNIKPLDEGQGYYVYEPVKGGRAAIIANDRSILCATSSVSFERHLEAFNSGKRSEIESN